MDPIVARLVARSRADSHAAPSLRPGVAADGLDAFERRHGVVLPPALRDLYAATDGSGEMIDDALIALSPLAEVVPFQAWGADADPVAPSSPDGLAWADRWFVFADYLISSHQYLVRLDADPGNPGPVVAWDIGRRPVAPTFAAFLAIWESGDDRAILGGNDLLPDDAP